MTGCGRQIRYVLDGRAYYTPCTSHDEHGHCQGWLTDVTTCPHEEAGRALATLAPPEVI